MSDISDKLKAARDRVMKRIRERREERRKTKTIPTPPRYDEVFFRGVEAMDRIATKGEVEMSEMDIIEKLRAYAMDGEHGILAPTLLEIEAADEIKRLRELCRAAANENQSLRDKCLMCALSSGEPGPVPLADEIKELRADNEQFLEENRRLRAENKRLCDNLDYIIFCSEPGKKGAHCERGNDICPFYHKDRLHRECECMFDTGGEL